MKLLGGEGSGVAEKRDNESRGNRENAVEPKRHRTRLVSIVTFLLALETAGFLSLALLQWLRGDLFERVSIPRAMNRESEKIRRSFDIMNAFSQ
jgi:hypothetical protein